MTQRGKNVQVECLSDTGSSGRTALADHEGLLWRWR